MKTTTWTAFFQFLCLFVLGTVAVAELLFWGIDAWQHHKTGQVRVSEHGTYQSITGIVTGSSHEIKPGDVAGVFGTGDAPKSEVLK